MIFRRDSFALIKFATWSKETVAWEEEDKENGMEAGFKEKREKEREKGGRRGRERKIAKIREKNQGPMTSIIGNRCVFAQTHAHSNAHTRAQIQAHIRLLLLRYEFSGAKSRAPRDVIESRRRRPRWLRWNEGIEGWR